MKCKNQICDRCHQPTATTIMSMFNTDMVCPDCKKTEEKHPLYNLARRKEREALLHGDYNFPGIGWPPGEQEESDDT